MSKKTKDPWVRMINVCDPILHKKGYTLYKVTSKVFPKNSVEAVTEVTVWKRYNDFKKLHKALHTIHQNLHLKGNFPPFAKARFFGRFDDTVIEERRLSALKLLQFANNFPPLFTSQVFVKFFEDGHSVEGCSLPPESNGSATDSTFEKSIQSVDILQPMPCNSAGRSPEDDIKSSRNSLGGTWQHHQIADNISLSSHCTEDDEDDRTTFTDDDSTNYRPPSFDLSEFDPLLTTNNINSNLIDPISNKNTISDNWLLSALQSCSNHISEKDAEAVLEFPTPFDDMEYGEIATPSNEYPSSAKSGSSSDAHFSFDSITSTQMKPEIDEFDPFSRKSLEKQDSEDSFYNCDEFATTPTALKNENKCQPKFILHASKYIVSAQEAEGNTNYAEAFEMYKKAIDVLLQGIQKNEFPDIRDAVRKKVMLYLMRAEEIYENKLPNSSNGKFKENSPFCINPANKISTLRGCVQDLNKYKVLGILGKVLLVLDISNNSTYVVKTLYKSSVPKTFDVPHIVPQNIPFMVNLCHIYETSYAIFLIIEHASGGKLWDYVSSYLQRSPLSPCNDGACLYLEPKSKAELSNIYSGKKVSENNASNNSNATNSVDSDLTPSTNCPQSYVALFKRYAASMNKEDNVALARYNKITNVPYSDKEVNITEEKSTSHNDDDLVSTLQSNCDTVKDVTAPNVKSQRKNSRNRLSSSTGSLETAKSQKTCLLEAFNAMDEAAFHTSAKPTHLPESCVYMWAAEIVVALESLHNLGITWMDFHPDNILLGPEGHILLTYQSKWSNVDFFVKDSAKENAFCAPEVGNIFPVTADCDWWSLGAILFELLTGRSLVSCHPTGITRHTILNFPSDISSDAKDFVSKLLQYNPSERLGSGIYGAEELKSHPFFRSVDWESLYNS